MSLDFVVRGKNALLPSCWRKPPLEATQYLLEQIKKNGKSIQAKQGDQIIQNNYAGLIAVERGAWETYLGESMIVSHVPSGSIIGLDSFFSTCPPSLPLWHKALVPSLYYECTKTELAKLNADTTFLRAGAEYLTWVYQCSISARHMLTSNNAYGKVRFAIEWLSSTAETYRQSHTLVSFICSRTNLSRSRVLDILKELKQGGYIEVDNGYFVRLCRDLPKGY
ncbi:helix-turn-helix domain-containing protein [Chromobacterium haemolyticum]|uniref:helix-turn-helix domain-containing protein n=1 Tax=Chromobacterium haemolyticum TaxID=394935 RepID=UPI00405597FB